MRLFGSSGIRAPADRGLLELALRVGLAVGTVYKDTIVGTDTRTSSEALKHSVLSGLLAAGANCADAGVLPTPTVALAARKFSAGVMITASHNPPEYNGIKLLNPDGSAFAPSQQRDIEAMVLDDSLRIAPWSDMKPAKSYQDAVEEHIERVLGNFKSPLKLKVVVDCGCGDASLVTPNLLRSMGCEVTALDCYPSGFFPHGAEPNEANLQNLMRAVTAVGADLGIAHDGDADRMMAVDDRGRFVLGDKLLVILAHAAGAKSVVTTVDASMAVEEAGFSVRRTRVGDSYVSEELKNGGDFGGEPSGAWVFPAVSLCPDGIYAAACIAHLAGQKRLSGLVDEIASYPIVRGSVASESVDTTRLEDVLMDLGPVSVSKADGIRLQFDHGWLLVRPSGTEPRIRLTAEARTAQRAQQLYESGRKAVEESRSIAGSRRQP